MVTKGDEGIGTIKKQDDVVSFQGSILPPPRSIPDARDSGGGTPITIIEQVSPTGEVTSSATVLSSQLSTTEAKEFLASGGTLKVGEKSFQVKQQEQLRDAPVIRPRPSSTPSPVITDDPRIAEREQLRQETRERQSQFFLSRGPAGQAFIDTAERTKDRIRRDVAPPIFTGTSFDIGGTRQDFRLEQITTPSKDIPASDVIGGVATGAVREFNILTGKSTAPGSPELIPSTARIVEQQTLGQALPTTLATVGITPERARRVGTFVGSGVGRFLNITPGSDIVRVSDLQKDIAAAEKAGVELDLTTPAGIESFVSESRQRSEEGFVRGAGLIGGAAGASVVQRPVRSLVIAGIAAGLTIGTAGLGSALAPAAAAKLALGTKLTGALLTGTFLGGKAFEVSLAEGEEAKAEIIGGAIADVGLFAAGSLAGARAFQFATTPRIDVTRTRSVTGGEELRGLERAGVKVKDVIGQEFVQVTAQTPLGKETKFLVRLTGGQKVTTPTGQLSTSRFVRQVDIFKLTDSKLTVGGRFDIGESLRFERVAFGKGSGTTTEIIKSLTSGEVTLSSRADFALGEPGRAPTQQTVIEQIIAARPAGKGIVDFGVIRTTKGQKDVFGIGKLFSKQIEIPIVEQKGAETILKTGRGIRFAGGTQDLGKLSIQRVFSPKDFGVFGSGATFPGGGAPPKPPKIDAERLRQFNIRADTQQLTSLSRAPTPLADRLVTQNILQQLPFAPKQTGETLVGGLLAPPKVDPVIALFPSQTTQRDKSLISFPVEQAPSFAGTRPEEVIDLGQRERRVRELQPFTELGLQSQEEQSFAGALKGFAPAPPLTGQRTETTTAALVDVGFKLDLATEQRQALASRTRTPTRQITSQITPTPTEFPFPFLFPTPRGGRKPRVTPRRRPGQRERSVFTPSLVGLITGAVATEAEGRALARSPTQVLGIRPQIIRTRRKKKKGTSDPLDVGF